MPQPYKGRRVKMTIRLPADVYHDAAKAAAARRWNMTTFVGWCVENQLKPITMRAAERRADQTVAAANLSPGGRRDRRRRGTFTPDLGNDDGDDG